MSNPSPTDPAPSSETRHELDDTPPILGSWRNIYAFVLVTLAVLVALFAAITEAYA